METKHRKGTFLVNALNPETFGAQRCKARDLFKNRLVQHGKAEPIPLKDFINVIPGTLSVLELLAGGYGCSGLENYQEMSPYELLSWADQHVRGISEVANISTVLAHKSGFNNHGYDRHIRPIAEDACKSASEWGVDSDELRVVLLATFFHDTGMVFSRKLHPFISPRIFNAVLPDLASTEPGRKATHVIVNHDDSVFTRRVDGWKKDNPNQDKDEQQLYTYLRKKLGKESLYLMILDKIQVGIERVTPNGHNYEEDVMTDVHTLVTAFLRKDKSSDGYFKKDGDVATLKLKFQPDLGEESDQFSHIQHSNKHQIHAPELMHKAHREHGYPHLFWWFEKYISTYESRINSLARAAFSLDMNLKQFKIIIKDGPDNGNWQMGFEISIDRGQLLSELGGATSELGDNIKVNSRIYDAYKLMSDFGDDIRRIRSDVAPGISFYAKSCDVQSAREMRELFVAKSSRKAKGRPIYEQ